MAVKSPPSPYVFNQIEYPESDGQPMAETGTHVTVIAEVAKLRTELAQLKASKK